MKTIISATFISEDGFTPIICCKIYDSKINKFCKTIGSKISKEVMFDIYSSRIKLEDIIDSFLIDSIIPDEEVISTYNEMKNSGMHAGISITTGAFDRDTYTILENYVKSLEREDKLTNLGIE